MRVEVLDASVVGAAFFNEEGSALARDYLTRDMGLVAPDLLFAELASLASKKVWRKEAPVAAAERALGALPEFVSEFVDSAELAARALGFAMDHRFSAYDGMYLALAEQRATRVATLDLKLVERARACGLTHLVSPLGHRQA